MISLDYFAEISKFLNGENVNDFYEFLDFYKNNIGFQYDIWIKDNKIVWIKDNKIVNLCPGAIYERVFIPFKNVDDLKYKYIEYKNKIRKLKSFA